MYIRRRKGIKTFFEAKFERFWAFQEKSSTLYITWFNSILFEGSEKLDKWSYIFVARRVKMAKLRRSSTWHCNEDRKVKTTVGINAIKTESDIVSNMVERISSWKKLLRVMASVMKFVKRMKKISADENESNVLTVKM